MAGAVIFAIAFDARAGKREALELFDRGERVYNAERFAEAIELFERAYAEHPAAEFLFNIAQAHRKLGHCEEALVFYRRYLEQAKTPKMRPEVEGHVAKLRAQCIAPTGEDTLEEKQPPPPMLQAPPEKKELPASKPMAVEPPLAAAATPQVVQAQREQESSKTDDDISFVLAASAGGAFVLPKPHAFPAQLALALELGAEIPIDELRVEVVARFDTNALPYESTVSRGTMRLFGANMLGAVLYRVGSSVELRAAACGGIKVLSGLASGNPFVLDNAEHETVVMPSAAGFIGARFSFSESVFARSDLGYEVSIAPGSFMIDRAISKL